MPRQSRSTERHCGSSRARRGESPRALVRHLSAAAASSLPTQRKPFPAHRTQR